MPPLTIPARTPCDRDKHLEGVREGARLLLKYTLGGGEDSAEVTALVGL